MLAVTGHRPDKLGGYGWEAKRQVVFLAYDAIKVLSPQEVITGMALGWDQAVAEACTMLGIPFFAYIPFSGQESKWPRESQQEYQRLLGRAKHVVTVSNGGYAPYKMQLRNEAMIDKADSLLALWNGSAGGTANAVGYAIDKDKPVTNVWRAFETYYRR